jgi:hypothetical protein
MRIKHTLWRVSNGWLLVPEDRDGYLTSEHAAQCSIFKTLREFSDQYPKRERRKRAAKTVTTNTEEK